jgi:hypothetical protein
MKTKYNQMRRTLLIFGGLFLALLLSDLPHLYAEDQGADSPVVEPKEKNITANEQPMEPDITRGALPLVGPSGEEIHDFLYPTTENRKVVTPAN